jgi:hypothetical protein
VPVISQVENTPGARRPQERRAVVRHAVRRVTRAGLSGEDVASRWAILRDLSAWGLGLLLARPMPVGTVLAVTPWLWQGNPPPRLLARVVRSREEVGGWLHGCELTEPLSDDQLHALLA